MPVQVVIFLIFVAALLLLLHALSKGNPARAALMLRRTVGGGLILLSILLVTRGLVSLAIPAALLGGLLLSGGRFFGLSQIMRRFRRSLRASRWR